MNTLYTGHCTGAEVKKSTGCRIARGKGVPYRIGDRILKPKTGTLADQKSIKWIKFRILMKGLVSNRWRKRLSPFYTDGSGKVLCGPKESGIGVWTTEVRAKSVIAQEKGKPVPARWKRCRPLSDLGLVFQRVPTLQAFAKSTSFS